MKVVVTGISSFVGCHLARHWASLGHRVTGTISRPRGEYVGIAARRLALLEPLVEFDRLDLREPRQIAAAVERCAPELWIHHAGYSANYGSPDYDLEAAQEINVVPLVSLYSTLRGGGCGVILTGSSMEYAAADRGNREGDACLPDTPYGLSKLAATLRARQLAERWGVRTRVARLYIPFGNCDNPNKLLSQAVAALRAKQPLELSPCEQRRDFLGVSDVCDAYVRLARDLPRVCFDIFNIASGEGVVLREFLLRIAARLGAAPDLLCFGRMSMRPGESLVSYADIGKAHEVLAWKPTPLDRALDRDLLAEDVATSAAH